jgi:hypothetical protein
MDTLARFLAFYKPISDGLSAAGWVKTSDTGQVDWVTLTLPSANTFVYEIWRMADAAQATCPCFMKLRYYRGNSANAMRLGLELGTGSNGSGTLTGNLSTLAVNSDTNATAGYYTNYFSGGNNRMQLGLRADVDAYNPVLVSVERRKSNAGADLDDWLGRIYGGPSATSGGFQQIAKPGSAWAQTTVQTVPIAWTNLTDFIGNGGPIISPVFPIWGMVDSPLLGIVYCGKVAISVPQLVKVKLYGAWHDYVVLSTSASMGWHNDVAGCLLWE